MSTAPAAPPVPLDRDPVPACAGCSNPKSGNVPVSPVPIFADGKLVEPAGVYEDGRIWHPACWKAFRPAILRAQRKRAKRR